jgi:hypothetical protein
MALTRKFLSALGIEADKVDEIISAHTEVTDALKQERDQYKADAEKLPEVQKELDDLKANTDGKNTWKVKYEALKEDFDQYKADTEAKATKASKEEAYKKLLEETGVSPKRISAIVKVTDLDSIELDDSGMIKDADKVKNGIKEEWSDFIQTKKTEGAPTPTPPGSSGGTLKTREEIYARDESGRFKLDATQRQEALSKLITSETKG